ncbi:hypothetical protein ABK040_012588 [Willaertia magna]
MNASLSSNASRRKILDKDLPKGLEDFMNESDSDEDSPKKFKKNLSNSNNSYNNYNNLNNNNFQPYYQSEKNPLTSSQMFKSGKSASSNNLETQHHSSKEQIPNVAKKTNSGSDFYNMKSTLGNNNETVTPMTKFILTNVSTIPPNSQESNDSISVPPLIHIDDLDLSSPDFALNSTTESDINNDSKNQDKLKEEEEKKINESDDSNFSNFTTLTSTTSPRKENYKIDTLKLDYNLNNNNTNLTTIHTINNNNNQNNGTFNH